MRSVVIVMRRLTVTVLLIVGLALAYLPASATASIHGQSRKHVAAGEYAVTGCSHEIPENNLHSFYWAADDSPVIIWIVAQDHYNLSDRGEPATYFVRVSGQAGEHVLSGPLPKLYYVILSPTSQYVTTERWIEVVWENGVRLYGPTIGSMTILLLLISGVFLIRRRRQPSPAS